MSFPTFVKNPRHPNFINHRVDGSRPITANNKGVLYFCDHRNFRDETKWELAYLPAEEDLIGRLALWIKGDDGDPDTYHVISK